MSLTSAISMQYTFVRELEQITNVRSTCLKMNNLTRHGKVISEPTRHVAGFFHWVIRWLQSKFGKITYFRLVKALG